MWEGRLLLLALSSPSLPPSPWTSVRTTTAKPTHLSFIHLHPQATSLFHICALAIQNRLKAYSCVLVCTGTARISLFLNFQRNRGEPLGNSRLLRLLVSQSRAWIIYKIWIGLQKQMKPVCMLMCVQSANVMPWSPGSPGLIGRS